MIYLNAVERGADDATLRQVIGSMTPEGAGDLLKAWGMEVVSTNEEPDGWEPLTKSTVFDLVKAAKGGKKQKVMKRILVRMKNGKTYFREQLVNADEGKAISVQPNMNVMQTFDAHVANVRSGATAHLTEYASSVADMEKTAEGKAALAAINKAIGSGSPSGILTKGLNYTDIRFCPKPQTVRDENGHVINGCVAIAKNPNTGKDQYFYSKDFREEHGAMRRQRTMLLATADCSAWVNHVLNDKKVFEGKEDIQACLKLMYNYGLKTGNEEQAGPNQLGKIKTVGATTLTAENVVIKKARVWNKDLKKQVTVEKVYLEFHQTGEKGDGKHGRSIEITDASLAQYLVEKKNACQNKTDRIFKCNKNQTLAVCQELFSCNSEDLRTAFGFKKWLEARDIWFGKNLKSKRMQKTDPDTGEKRDLTRAEIKKEITDWMKEQMGVTDTRSVQQYINDKLIAAFYPESGGTTGKKTGTKKTVTKKKTGATAQKKTGSTAKKAASAGKKATVKKAPATSKKKTAKKKSSLKKGSNSTHDTK